MPRFKVLIVEDEFIVAEDLSHKVRALGYEVIGIVSSSDQATRVARESPADIVLLDIHLVGNLDGIATAQELKNVCDPAIVFVTAHSDAQTVKKAEAIGPFGYILKPFGERDLAVQLEIALHKHRTNKALLENEKRLRQANQELTKAQDILLAAQRGAKAGIWEIDLSSGKITWSAPYFELFGIAPSVDPSVTAWLSCIHPDDRGRISAEHQQSMKEKRDQNMEFRIVKPDGTVRWIHRKGQVEFNENGKAVRINGISFDITDRKQAEEAISAVALFPEQNPSPVLRVNRGGILLYMNPASELLLGELQLKAGKPVPSLLQDLVLQSLQTGQLKKVEHEIGACHYLISITPIVKEHYSNLYWTNITERKRAEDALRSAVAFDEAVMNNMGEGLYTVNDEGLVTSMNPAAEKLFGWTFDELRGKKMHLMTHHHYSDGRPFPSEECAGLRVLREGATLVDHEDVFIRKDGTFFNVVYSSSPIRDGEIIKGLIVVFREIIDRKRNGEGLR